MSSSPLAVGIDLGGTTTAVGLVDRSGDVRAFDRFPTHAETGPEGWVSRVKESVLGLQQNIRNLPIGVGMGSPGPLDLDTGFLRRAVNLGWADVPLKGLLEDAFSLPSWVHSDGVTATLGEWWRGAARGNRDVVGITLGTGVGGGVIIDGRIQRGARAVAGHIGHITVEPSGRPCPCGKQGCVEAYASASAVSRIYQEEVASVGRPADLASAKLIAEAARSSDTQAVKVFHQAAFYLAIAIDSLANVLDPDVIVISGGLAGAGAVLFDPLLDSLSKLSEAGGVDVPRVLPGQLGLKSGVIGAGALVHGIP